MPPICNEPVAVYSLGLAILAVYTTWGHVETNVSLKWINYLILDKFVKLCLHAHPGYGNTHYNNNSTTGSEPEW